ncbi:GyrI-like domain-containing protein [Paenibacillus sp. AR247]|uniref:GyrI-like domain-containing protein n=1 Tax=Paenibacillus sp. AR247 TaxID=1631599 RepID=UPI00215781E0|nr:GyrI-like domain-containing protein [Paenibacillus sp. AR247]
MNLMITDNKYYHAPDHPELIELENNLYLTISDQGAPGGSAHLAAVQALHTSAYGVKSLMMMEGKDFIVPVLEGLWWVDGNKPVREVPMEQWYWKLLIRVPDYVTESHWERTKIKAIMDNPLIQSIVLETINEGKCVQMMHNGPYDREQETVDLIEAFMKDHNLVQNGLHHEIYISDIMSPPRRRQGPFYDTR